MFILDLPGIPSLTSKLEINPILAISFGLILLLLSGFVLVYYCYDKKRAHHRIPQMTWELNELHETEESDNEVEEEPVLPDCLRKINPEMIYPQSCIEKTQQLGQGEFGSVFKGKLTQGNAVYVKLLSTNDI